MINAHAMQGQVKQTMNNAMLGTDYSNFNVEEIDAFVISIVKPMLKKFIYVSPDVIMKVSIQFLSNSSTSKCF